MFVCIVGSEMNGTVAAHLLFSTGRDSGSSEHSTFQFQSSLAQQNGLSFLESAVSNTIAPTPIGMAYFKIRVSLW